MKYFFLLSITFFSLYLMLALISFDPGDKSWSNSTSCLLINNITGSQGAYFADILFIIFGVVAYVIPCFLLYFCWNIFLQARKLNFLVLSFRIIGSVLILFSSCSLFSLTCNDFYHFNSGGIIGIIFTDIFALWFKYYESIIVAFIFWFIGVILLFGYSCVYIFKKIASFVRRCMRIIYYSKSNFILKNNCYLRMNKKYRMLVKSSFTFDKIQIIFSNLFKIDTSTIQESDNKKYDFCPINTCGFMDKETHISIKKPYDDLYHHVIYRYITVSSNCFPDFFFVIIIHIFMRILIVF